MTAKVLTMRSMLLDLHARSSEREALIGTNRILALTVERLHAENEALMRMVGRLTAERLGK